MCNYYVKNKSDARSLVCYFANREIGITTIDISKRLNICQSAMSWSSYRGEMPANEYDFKLIIIDVPKNFPAHVTTKVIRGLGH